MFAVTRDDSEPIPFPESETLARRRRGDELRHVLSASTGFMPTYARSLRRLRNGVEIFPAMLAAIAMHETGNGTSNAVRSYNNPGGLMNPRTNWSTLQRYGSLEQGIDAMARNLKRNYIDKGLTSIPAIGRKYAPVGAANDPRGLNQHWANGVQHYLQRILGRA